MASRAAADGWPDHGPHRKASHIDDSGDGLTTGTTGWVTLTIAPGRYEIERSEVNHSEGGMWAQPDVARVGRGVSDHGAMRQRPSGIGSPMAPIAGEGFRVGTTQEDGHGPAAL